MKVFLYIVRRTLGFKRREDAVSLAQICGGITSKDGRVLDRGTGLVRSAAANAANGLIGRGLIERLQQTAGNGGHLPSLYRLRFVRSVSPGVNRRRQEKAADSPGVASSRPQSTPPSPPQRTTPSPLERTTLVLQGGPTRNSTTRNRTTRLESTPDAKPETDEASQLNAIQRSIEAFGLGKPDQVILDRTIKAGLGASGYQVAAYLYDRLRFILANPQHAPKSFGWFPKTVTEHFRRLGGADPLAISRQEAELAARPDKAQ